MTDTGDHFVDRAHRPEPVDAVARVDLHRSRQAAFGTEVHPETAAFAAKLARVLGDPAARPAVPVVVPTGHGPRAADGAPAGSVPPLDVAGAPHGAGGPVPPVLGAPHRVAGTPDPSAPDDESTVKLSSSASHSSSLSSAPSFAPSAAAPGQPRFRPSPRPRVRGTGALGVVEGPASATTKAPAAGPLPGPGALPAGPLPAGPPPAGPVHAGPGSVPGLRPVGPPPVGPGPAGPGTGPGLLPAGPVPAAPAPAGPVPVGPGSGPGLPPAGPVPAGAAPAGGALPGVLRAAGPAPCAETGMPEAAATHAGMPHAAMPHAGMPHAVMPLAAVPEAGVPAAPVRPAGPAPLPDPARGPLAVPPAARPAAPAGPAVHPADQRRADPHPVDLHDVDVSLPAAPALVCDRGDRILQVNAALVRLTGCSDADGGLHGRRVSQIVVGVDTDARLVRADGGLVRVRVVRWDLPDRKLQVVVFVELLDAYAAEIDRDAARRWTAELERMARAGSWRYELATGTLHRSEALQQLYRSIGVEPDASGGPVEGEQVALLVRALRAGQPAADHQAELRLPGGLRLSCRAEVERGADGTPARLTGVVRDVTAQHETEARARHAARRFADLAALVPTGIAIVDPDGYIREANPALCALLDVAPEQLRGLPAAALSADPVGAGVPAAPDDPLPPSLPDWLRPVPPGAQHRYRVEAAPLLRGDGTTVWCELAVSATTLDDDEWLWILACTDIGEKRRAAELLRSAGTVDELTRLPNRTACLELLERLLARPERDQVAVVCGDVDDFQRVNSSLGHEAGDELLVTLAGRLQRELPVGCTAVRLAADEFVVVCSDVDGAGGPAELAGTVGDLLRATVAVRGRTVQLTASVGLAVAEPGSDLAPSDLLRFAEVAMHDAKRTCRGGMAVATDRVVGTATRALELEAELRAAIAADGLVLEYQPVVGPDGLVRSAEALVRWPHPEHGVIAPADFLPVAQRGGMLRELDEWVLRTAAREAVGWPEHGGHPVAVAVNLAGLLPSDADFRATVSAIVEAAGLPWDRLVLEVVETSLVALPPHALAAMDHLVALGVRFAVDDFGTGYSSLARLKELPAQIVKVDRAFVTGVGTDPADFAVTRAVVDIAKAMGRSTVAEGVETTEQYNVLRGVGVDAYQGWLFARALAPWQLRELLAGGRVAVPAAPPASSA